MVKYWMLLLALAGVGVAAQPTNAPPASAMGSFQAQTGPRTPATPFELKPLKPNEIQSGKLRYSGIGVEAVKTRKPWQLVNPLAPPQYGSPEDNVVRDPIGNGVTGLKVFAIQF